MDCCDRNRGNGFKLKEERLDWTYRRCYYNKVVRYWNRLLRQVVDALPLVVKIRLDRTLRNLM